MMNRMMKGLTIIVIIVLDLSVFKSNSSLWCAGQPHVFQILRCYASMECIPTFCQVTRQHKFCKNVSSKIKKCSRERVTVWLIFLL